VGWVSPEKAAVVYYEIAMAMDGFFHRHWPAAAETHRNCFEWVPDDPGRSRKKLL